MENKHEEQRKQFWMDAWIACRNKGSGVQSCIDVADDALKALDERFPNPGEVAKVEESPKDEIIERTCGSCKYLMMPSSRKCQTCILPEHSNFEPKD